MTPAAWKALGLLGAVIALMFWGKVRLDVLGLSIPIALVLLGLAAPQTVFAGFSNPAVLTLIFIFMITRGLERTGAGDALARRMMRWIQGEAGRPRPSERRVLAVVVGVTALLSLTMNTVAAAAVALSPTLTLSRRLKLPASRLLLPVAYAALLGGMATLLTTANLVADAALRHAGYPGFRLYSFLPVGLPATFVGLTFLVWAAPRLLPDRPAQAPAAPTGGLPLETYRLMHGLHALRIRPDSPLVGRSARRPHLARTLGLTPLGRLDDAGFTPSFLLEDERLRPGDVLIVAGEPKPDALARQGLEWLPHKDWLDQYMNKAPLMEVALHPHGQAAGKTPKDLRLRERYAALVLALWRAGRVYYQALYREPLQPGDALLVQGPPEGLQALSQDPDFLPLSPPPRKASPRAMRMALAWWGLVLALAAFTRLPLAWAALVGVVGMALSGLLPMEEAYRAVEWRAVFLIAGMLPLSQALLESGAVQALTARLLPQNGHLPAVVLLGLLVLLASLLAQVLSGQVSALVLVPWAIALARQVGFSPQIAGMAVAVGASLAFLLPTGHPANLLVLGPGGYTPKDYLRLGLPLTLVVFPVIVAALWLLAVLTG